MQGSLRVAIVGGGIGGLTAALALRAGGLDVIVFEQAEILREIGAGVSIHPNAARLLKRIGLDDQLRKIGSPIGGITLRTSQGDAITTPEGPATPAFSRDSQGYNVHRADFLNLLFTALPEGTVNLGHRCIGLKKDDNKVRLSFANGSSVDADIVIGADGIHSVIQREIGLESRPASEGTMAYRGLVPAERLAWADELKDPALWLGSGRSFLLYPVAGGRLINMVAFVPTDTDSEESWSAPGDVKALATEYEGWDKPVVDVINSLEETFRWGIYDRAPLPYWSTARVTLMGDAAHPMVPHLGQGAGQSIEDAITLGVLLEGCAAADIADRLRLYETLRLARTSRIQAFARAAGKLYRSEHDDPLEKAGQLSEWMAQGKWLFEHDAEKAARDALAMSGH
ncbi:FAD-dependent monooxygenase [Bradyrhizobium sp. CB1650]|uniref:FAD-dependent monooxygenase n=1 Tax=Bradyrhizobium sp. CB1650 TaxID=3039153 RepID=UPI0024354C3A|nr:FAD-dependent monooxygenase [Bradyrhizobium sp. CB1650]WGD50176.1 FAD-dependent monooxygenase [Bradyrhizobium sp. CB1650]